MSQVTIEVPCGKVHSHPVTIDIVNWASWRAIAPICKRHWFFRWFPRFAPCRRYLESRSQSLRLAVVDAIFASDPKPFLPILIEALSDETVISLQVFTRLEPCTDYDFVLAVCEAGYSSPHSEVRNLARQLVYREQVTQALPLVESLIANSRKKLDFRLDLMTVLAQWRKNEAIRILLRLVHSSETSIQSKALELLRQDISQFIAQVQSLLHQIDTSLKEAVLIVLSTFKGEAKIPILKVLVTDSSYSVRRIATAQLALVVENFVGESSQLDRLDELGLRDTFYRLAQDTSVEIRKTACRILGRFPHAMHIPLLEHLLQDPTPDVREEACEALTRHGEAAIPQLVNALGNSHESVCITAESKLVMFVDTNKPSQAALKLLVDAAGSECPCCGAERPHRGGQANRVRVNNKKSECSCRKRYLAAAILARRRAARWTEILISALWSQEPDWLKDRAEEGLLKIGELALETLKENLYRPIRSREDSKAVARLIRVFSKIVCSAGHRDSEVENLLEAFVRESIYHNLRKEAREALERVSLIPAEPN